MILCTWGSGSEGIAPLKHGTRLPHVWGEPVSHPNTMNTGPVPTQGSKSARDRGVTVSAVSPSLSL